MYNPQQIQGIWRASPQYSHNSKPFSLCLCNVWFDPMDLIWLYDFMIIFFFSIYFHYHYYYFFRSSFICFKNVFYIFGLVHHLLLFLRINKDLIHSFLYGWQLRLKRHLLSNWTFWLPAQYFLISGIILATKSTDWLTGIANEAACSHLIRLPHPPSPPAPSNQPNN